MVADTLSRMVTRWNRNRQVRRAGRSLAADRRPARMEQLESRLMMSLLGITPSFPAITFGSGTVVYDAGGLTFDSGATPLTFRESAVSAPRAISAPKGMQIHINVDNSGNLIGGVPGDDFVLTGTIDINGDTIPDVSGTLLTGEILQFGFLNASSGTTDNYDFRFQVTGGALAPLYYTNKDIGLTITSENSTFNGVFDSNFLGQAKGSLGTINKLAALGDYVWIDADGDGKQGANEAGVDGVLVKLLDSSNNVISTQLTHDGGFYKFDLLTPGAYSVEFANLPSGHQFTTQNVGTNGFDAIDSDADTTTGRTQQVTLVAGEYNDTLDAGLLKPAPLPAALGDFVWEDTNANGQQDLGELGIDGVLVTLLDSSNNVLATQFTHDGGAYFFDGLAAGTYHVNFDMIPGYARTSTDTGADESDSDADGLGNTGDYTLAAGETNRTVDAGYYRPASLGDYVWEDANANGQQDLGELGIDGVLVTLLDGSGNFVDSMTTSGGGAYLFTDLIPGDYKVVFAAVPGYVRTSTDTGADASDSDADASGATGVYTLQSGDENLTVDAGYYRLASLGDFVWEDADADGQQDGGELGIDGVLVTLLDSSNNIVATQSTHDGGAYLFTDLTPGTYHVSFAAIPGFLRSPADSGADATDSDADAAGLTGNYTLQSGDQDLTVDAGYYRLASIGDFVWQDVNGNGQQDGGVEVGIDGVLVTLYDGSNNVISTQFTHDGGFYLFTGLTPGDYRVGFGSYLDYTFTIANNGLDATDSDADVNTGLTGLYTLASGEQNLTVDAGLKAPIAPPSAGVDIEKFIQVVTTNTFCYEGLTPGYWKQCQHFDDWAGYTPSQKYETVFGVNVPGTPSLLDALGANGGGVYALMRHSTAALLNSTHPTIEYFYTTAQVISMTQAAIGSGDANLIESTKNLLASQNEKGANLHNASGGNCGSCGSGSPTTTTTLSNPEDADNAPGISVNVGDQLKFTYYVKNTGEVALTNVVVVDDNATPGDNSDDFNPAAVLSGGFNVGDINQDGKLDLTETWQYTANGSVGSAGTHGNISVVTATPVGGGDQVADSDPAFWSTPVNLVGSIDGFVYVDADNDGIFDSGEAPIAGVTVKLTGTTTTGQPVSLTAVTNASGYYEFTNLKAGTYTVTETQPAAYNDGKDTAGTLGGNTSVNDKISAIVLGAGQDSNNNNFGERLGLACLSGYVYVDANCDGELDANEVGIAGVTVKLTGTTVNGQAVSLTATTDSEGYYHFDNLLAGTYTITETQPAGYNDGGETVGSLGGSKNCNDQISCITVPASAVCGINYNFGEKNKVVAPPSLVCGMTATIGFWQNKNGQALIKCLNGGSTAKALGNWLATNYANLFGCLAGKTNAQVATHFTQLFNVTGTKLEAQIMATALAVYVTNSTLAGNVASKYGFIVSASGTGAAGYNVGSAGTALGLANNTVYTINQILAAANSKASSGKLYATNSTYRTAVNTVFDGINNKGDIGCCSSSCGGSYGGGYGGYGSC